MGIGQSVRKPVDSFVRCTGGITARQHKFNAGIRARWMGIEAPGPRLASEIIIQRQHLSLNLLIRNIGSLPNHRVLGPVHHVKNDRDPNQGILRFGGKTKAR